MGVQIPSGASKWGLGYQTRQFDTQVDSQALNPWLSQTDAWINNPTSAGAGEVGNSAGETAGDGTVLNYLAMENCTATNEWGGNNPLQAGITASATPAAVFAENTDPVPGVINYPYNTSVDDYVEGDLGYDSPPES